LNNRWPPPNFNKRSDILLLLATTDKGATPPSWLGAMMANMHDVYSFQGTCTSGHLTIQRVAVSSRPALVVLAPT
jgi:hypothetical protein